MVRILIDGGSNVNAVGEWGFFLSLWEILCEECMCILNNQEMIVLGLFC